MPYLLGIDIGTSGTKTILIDPTGSVTAKSTIEYPLYSPQPLWSEQDPEDWWNATVGTIRSCLTQSGVRAVEVVGIGLSGQMHGAVFVDGNGNPLRRAILWNDQRTQSQCDWITNRIGADKVAEYTCNPVLTGFQAPKIVWLRENEPEVYAKVKRVLLPKDFIRYRLTGEYATEVSDASGTSLFDVKNRKWSAEMLVGCDIPASWMAESFESVEVSGKVNATAAGLTGLKSGTPVVGGGGDQAAGAVGNGIVETGILSNSLGTSGVVFAFSDTPRVDVALRLHTFCHAVPGKWHLMGVMLSAGGSLQWYRDAFGQPEKVVAGALGVDPYQILCDEAATAPAGSEGLVFLPYLTGERAPHPDPYARGAFVGITRRHTRAHFARAILEGVSFGLKDSLSVMQEMGLPISEVRASGGGARSGLWRQILADTSGVKHVTVNIDEGPALGVALLAGVGAGVYPSVEDACRSVIRVVDETAVNTTANDKYQPTYNVYRSLYPALKSAFHDLSSL
ncbi:MAG: xylulokinase [Chthonomonadales bacterium]